VRNGRQEPEGSTATNNDTEPKEENEPAFHGAHVARKAEAAATTPCAVITIFSPGRLVGFTRLLIRSNAVSLVRFSGPKPIGGFSGNQLL
jgi:hypothetical protein